MFDYALMSVQTAASLSTNCNYVFVNELSRQLFHIGNFCFWVPFLPRDVMLSAVCAIVVCLSVTLRYCIKTAKRKIIPIKLYDSPKTLSFWCERSWRNSNGITPYEGDKWKWGGLKLATFDRKCAITWKQYKIDAYFLLNWIGSRMCSIEWLSET